MTNNYEKLLQNKTLGSKVVLRNPIVMAPMTTYSGNSDGTISEAELKYYKRRAKEVGMLITATTYVIPSGKGFPNEFAAYSDDFMPSLKSLAHTIKGEGAVAILQMFHAGRMGLKEELPNKETLSASAVAPLREGAPTPRAMMEEEIQDTIKAFGEAARRTVEAGFDGLEIHGANTYLLQQFFSPHSNRREDQWGGSLKNRMKFPLAVIDEVKKAVKGTGKDNFIIGYRFSPEELENPGITLEDTLKFVDVLAGQGLDYLHVSLNNFWQTSMRDKSNKEPIITNIINKIQGRVPLIGVGYIHTPEEAEKALESGVDLIALGRELIMEPEWVTKVKEGRTEEIRNTLSAKDREVLEVPEPLWGGIMNAKGWFPVVD